MRTRSIAMPFKRYGRKTTTITTAAAATVSALCHYLVYRLILSTPYLHTRSTAMHGKRYGRLRLVGVLACAYGCRRMHRACAGYR